MGYSLFGLRLGALARVRASAWVLGASPGLRAGTALANARSKTSSPSSHPRSFAA